MNSKLLVRVIGLTATFALLSALAPHRQDSSPLAAAAWMPALPLVVLQVQGGESQMPARGPLSPKPPVSAEAKDRGKTTAVVLVIIGVIVILPLVLAGMRKKR
jgi:hypothetical protein